MGSEIVHVYDYVDEDEKLFERGLELNLVQNRETMLDEPLLKKGI